MRPNVTPLRFPSADGDVSSTVVMMTRERVHDLGVFKAVGMTPRQVIVMALTTVAVTSLVAGLIAVPAGIALPRAVLPFMAHGARAARINTDT